MRRTIILPLCLLTALGCEGRYVLGNVHQNDVDSGGSGGNALSGPGGSNAASGATGNSGGSSAAGASGGSSDAGAGGTGGSAPVSRSRWLASETFISSASTQTELSLVDLQNPQADPIVLDSQSGFAESFSGDGRWLVYDAGRSSTQADVYLLNLAGDRPG
jgi:hypothetical protein